MNTMCTPCVLMKYTVKQLAPNFEHYANPMVHPITRETISSYKKLMNDLATAVIWQTAFGKDFGGMAQGDNKTSQKGTNAILVMNHNKIKTVLKAGKKSHTQTRWQTTGPKKQTLAVFASLLGVI